MKKFPGIPWLAVLIFVVVFLVLGSSAYASLLGANLLIPLFERPAAEASPSP